MRPALSVAICAYDDRHRLSLCLEGLALQASADVEVIIINDGGPSLDDTLGLFARRLNLREDRLEPPSEAFRLAAARNLALRLARADRVLFLDQDCVAAPGVLAAHASYGPSPTVVAGIRRFLDESQVASLVPADVPGLADRELRRDFRQAMPRFWMNPGRKRPMNYRFVCGCQFSVPTAVIREIGGFWEEFVGWGHEDLEVAVRLGRAGCSLTPRPDLVVVHLDHPLRFDPETDGRNRDLLCRTQLERKVIRRGAPLRALSDAITPDL